MMAIAQRARSIGRAATPYRLPPPTDTQRRPLDAASLRYDAAVWRE